MQRGTLTPCKVPCASPANPTAAKATISSIESTVTVSGLDMMLKPQIHHCDTFKSTVGKKTLWTTYPTVNPFTPRSTLNEDKYAGSNDYSPSV